MSLDRRYGTIEDAILTPSEFMERETLGAVYRADGTLVSDALRERLMWRAVDPATIPASTMPTRTFDEAIYCGRLLYHFGHFLIETSPSLLWAMGSDLPVLMHGWKGARGDFPPFARFVLSALGIDEARIVRIDRPMGVHTLYLPPQRRTFDTDAFSSPMTACAFRLVSAAAGPASRRGRHIFFSRRFQASREHAENDALEALFQQSGFEIIAPERLEFSEQIKIAKESAFIAGLDGSALHLCGFMQGGICLILQNRDGQLKIFQTVNATANVKTFRFDVRKGFDPEALRGQIAECEAELARLCP
ncbi:MAG: glycosyltransferase family 61 protein [Alphaproteobacteria bacterium]|nr:glycosyltransferase family 61 protein [Alphaproteobacteria bacterium]